MRSWLTSPCCRDAFRHATEGHPDRADLLRETAARLDEHLAADPDQNLHPANVLAAICDELGIELDLATLPDEYLDVYAETISFDDDDDLPGAPDPRATSPP